MRNNSVEVIVISLSTATERRRNMTTMLEGSSLKWSFFDAHRGPDNPVLSYDAERVQSRFSRELSRQEIAVYSSHFSAMQAFLERDAADFLLILEDDVIFDIDFPLDSFANYCAERDFDYVRLFGRNPAKCNWIGYFVDRSIIRYKSSPAGTQAYLMSKRGAKIFTENFRSIEATLDLAMDRFWDSQMPLYSIFPFPVIERYSPTSIPIAAHDGALDAAHKLAWRVNRMMDKARKVYANVALRRTDAQMRRRSPKFEQVREVA